MKRISILIISLFLIVSSASGKDIFDFALDLYNNNDYYRSISEFNRFLFYYPGSKKKNDVYLYIVKSYYYAGQYDQTVSEIKKNKDKVSKKLYKNEFDLLLSKSYLYFVKAPTGFEPVHEGFADLSLTTWVRRHLLQGKITKRSSIVQ